MSVEKDNKKNKELLIIACVLAISGFISYLAIILLASYAFGEGTKFGIIMVVATVYFCLIEFFALKVEVDAGYYECRKCHHKFSISYFKALFAPHILTTRYVKCPECGQNTWAKKTISK